ncbi:helix-turn-helix domain-containing protein [Tepidimonas aquatica]|uniref:Acetoin catabolism regulatory protein n=1 Tax=Tepidimonas aquatica TaxID=247482 RepID=A0A554WF77_9BURK|nr:helix-turn-helix domain-containing protein [Tepidimonas aquatica]TSE22229.1 Acetoin catabolism regulatory protein [Tepidimonas aquatica]
MAQGVEYRVAPTAAGERLRAIEQARRRWLLHEGAAPASAAVEPWIVASWQRCLAWGRSPRERITFDAVSAAAQRRALQASAELRRVAIPVIEQTLGRAMHDTGYFALLTNADGVIIDVHGPVDDHNVHVHAIARVGVDLSERTVGTTAIGAALAELTPVWLHRGEHFFEDTAVYSCAGAPLWGPDGACLGMLDLTGVLAPERRALKHLVAVTARRIENALVLAQSHTLRLRLTWPGHLPGDDDDGLLALDGEGMIVAANRTAAHMLDIGAPWPHASEVLALPVAMLFDAARRQRPPLEVPTWGGLRVLVWAQTGGADAGAAVGAAAVPLRSREAALIRQAVAEAGGNVAEAARRLGISRATVYRRLAQRRDEPDTAA